MEKTGDNKIELYNPNKITCIFYHNLYCIFLATTKDDDFYNSNNLLTESTTYIRKEKKKFKEEFLVNFYSEKKFSCGDLKISN